MVSNMDQRVYNTKNKEKITWPLSLDRLTSNRGDLESFSCHQMTADKTMDQRRQVSSFTQGNDLKWTT